MIDLVEAWVRDRFPDYSVEMSIGDGFFVVRPTARGWGVVVQCGGLRPVVSWHRVAGGDMPVGGELVDFRASDGKVVRFDLPDLADPVFFTVLERVLVGAAGFRAA